MISLEKFVENIEFLQQKEEEMDEIFNMIGFENKIGDCLMNLSGKIVEHLVDGFDGDESIDDYINWWIYECEFGTESPEIYEEGEESLVLHTASDLYFFLKDIYNSKGE